MPIVTFDFPVQENFDEDDVRSMIVGRRQLSTEWEKTIYSPDTPEDNWRLVLPFPETYRNAFSSMCDANAHPHVTPSGRLCIFLNGTQGDKEISEDVARWVDLVGKPVAMKDYLAISFAIDYERRNGNPELKQTEIGALRAQAKPYGSVIATEQTSVEADKLVEHCVAFLNEMTCYKSSDCIVAMPSSEPTKEYNLPRYLAKYIAKKWGRDDLTKNVRTIKARKSIKGVPLTEKLDTLLGSIEVDEDVFNGKRVLLLDDLYQSGISMNYCGLLLLNAGARKIFGLACEKTCRNDDNVSGKL